MSRVASFKDDYKFGIESEDNLIETISNTIGVKLLKTGKRNIIDFSDENETVKVELKTRRNASTTYETTLLPINKISNLNSDKSYYYVFSFTDGLYYIKYDKPTFDGFAVNNNYWRGARMDIRNVQQQVVLIPISSLKKI